MKRFIFIFSCLITLSACSRDVNDAQIEGIVLDAATGLPISKASLQVENAYYQGGDYDGYGGYHSLEIATDSVGIFRLKFHKSAYLQVKATRSGYQEEFSEKHIVSNQSKLVLSLKKL